MRKRGPACAPAPIAWAFRIARGNGVSPGHAPPPWRGGGIPPGQRRQRRGGWRPQGPGSRNRTRVSWGGPQLPCASKLNARHQARNSCQPAVQVQPVVAVMAGAPFLRVVRGVGWFRSSRWWRSWPGLLSCGWCGGWGGSGPAGGGGHGRGSFPAGVVRGWGGSGPAGGGGHGRGSFPAGVVRGVGWFRSSRWWRSRSRPPSCGCADLQMMSGQDPEVWGRRPADTHNTHYGPTSGAL